MPEKQFNFYKNSNGKEPVMEWILSKPKAIQKKIFTKIKTVEILLSNNNNISDKLIKKLREDIWEIKIDNIRVLFTKTKEYNILLHIFEKKTNKTPKQDIETAQNRLKELL